MAIILPRAAVYLVFGILVLGGGTFVADALVETDEERLGSYADELVKADRGAEADVVRGWAELSRSAVRVEGPSGVERFDDGREELALTAALQDALRPLSDARRVDVVQRAIRIDGDRGTVALRVRADGQIENLTLRFARSGQGWVLDRVRRR